ncbi:MAG: RNA polymerase sigma factor [Acidimicrobiales bacterium]
MTFVMAGSSGCEPGGDDDEVLLVAARCNPAAFAELYDRRYKRVLGFFYRRILCPHTAAELTAETFAQAWASRSRFDPSEGMAMAWVMGIAGNLYRNWLRRGVVSDRARRRWGITTPMLVEEDLEKIEALVDLTALRTGLIEALAELSPKLREAVLLRVALDLPYEAVATELGCSVGAARVRVSRGLDRLFVSLDNRP